MLVLQRGRETAAGTHGTLYKDGKLVCFTLELQWKANKSNISCIPAGVYNCEKHTSARFPDTWHVMNVPGREAILIHAGNTKADIRGCILVGLGVNDGGITQSQAALTKLRGLYKGGFVLEVRNSG